MPSVSSTPAAQASITKGMKVRAACLQAALWAADASSGGATNGSISLVSSTSSAARQTAASGAPRASLSSRSASLGLARDISTSRAMLDP
ncbi:hypothetical protein [Caulobacter sp. UC70_42]|uniref:hypothetical protein n=1 Tax=Caulobacter sp. UC70_42 TaxID=3374551 RepID=UPI003756DA42